MNLKINGIAAVNSAGKYSAVVTLKEYKNVIEVQDSVSGETTEIDVYWLKNVVDKYRLSIDDNIWFLKDINSNS
ncbi:MAG: hypothetical protein IPJ37_07600 [Bacteroidales bacterium]|nr:hypothetical protein [Bacteroidales bacterium]